MKKIILMVICSISLSYGIDTIKNIPECTAKIANYIYRTELNDLRSKKDAFWYFRKRSAIEERLKQKDISYYTKLKKGMRPKKLFYSKVLEEEVKKYAIIVAIAIENNILISDIIGN